MEEFLRKYVSRRLLALSEGEIAALTTSVWQIGMGAQGSAEALTIHQLLFNEWTAGSLSGPLARIKVDEKNCFGMIEWKAVHEVASRFLPKHTAAAWQHRNLSYVEQEGLLPMPKDRGAEQGDVDGPLECSLGSGMVAAGTQTGGSLPWIGVTDDAELQQSSRKSAPGLTTRDTHCRKKAAWQTCGMWMTLTSCVTRSWCRPACGNSMLPTPKSERSGTL